MTNMGYTEIHNFVNNHFNEWEQELREALKTDKRKVEYPDMFEVVEESVDNAILAVKNMLDNKEFSGSFFLGGVTDFRVVVGDSEEYLLSRILLHMSVGYVPVRVKLFDDGKFNVLFLKITE